MYPKTAFGTSHDEAQVSKHHNTFQLFYFIGSYVVCRRIMSENDTVLKTRTHERTLFHRVVGKVEKYKLLNTAGDSIWNTILDFVKTTLDYATFFAIHTEKKKYGGLSPSPSHSGRVSEPFAPQILPTRVEHCRVSCVVHTVWTKSALMYFTRNVATGQYIIDSFTASDMSKCTVLSKERRKKFFDIQADRLTVRSFSRACCSINSLV